MLYPVELTGHRRFCMVPRAGVEPATLGLEVLCSIQLSYRGKNAQNLTKIDHHQLDRAELHYLC